MQTLFPYDVNDIDFINNFIDNIFSKNIQKAKVYIKNPSEAPKGAKVQEGERGGHYYESEGQKLLQPPQLPQQSQQPKLNYNINFENNNLIIEAKRFIGGLNAGYIHTIIGGENVGQNNAYLNGILVHEQGIGLGRELVERTEKILYDKGINEIFLTPVGKEAENFWKHMGYGWNEEAWRLKRKKMMSKKIHISNKSIQKVKVYIKNPSDAPQGAKINRGEQGGLYYESEERQHFLHETTNIMENIQRYMKFSNEEEKNVKAIIQKYEPIAKQEFQKVLEVIGGNISYRIKNKYSILEKMRRKTSKPSDMRVSDLHYPTSNKPYEIQDIFGMRIETNTIDDIYNTVKKLENIYGDRIISKEDYIKAPKGIYRAYHMNIDYGNGIYGEIQIRTSLMDRIANASHILLYKNTKEMDVNLKTDINNALDIYSAIAVGQSTVNDLKILPKTKEVLREFGL